jgi:hypothetical protein
MIATSAETGGVGFIYFLKYEAVLKVNNGSRFEIVHEATYSATA